MVGKIIVMRLIVKLSRSRPLQMIYACQDTIKFRIRTPYGSAFFWLSLHYVLWLESARCTETTRTL